MSDKVVSLRGTFEPEALKPNNTLVEELERLLAAARAGEIVGMAGSYCHPDRSATYSYAGVVGSFGLIGALDCVKDRLVGLARGA
jgi:hypothetical protein